MVTQLFNDVIIKTKVYLIPKCVMSGCIDSQWIGITGRHTFECRREVPSYKDQNMWMISVLKQNKVGIEAVSLIVNTVLCQYLQHNDHSAASLVTSC